MNSARGYNDQAIYREELNKAQTLSLAIKKAVDYLNICITIFPNFIIGLQNEGNDNLPKNIMESFLKILSLDYGEPIEDLINQTSTYKFWPMLQDEYSSSGSEYAFGASRVGQEEYTIDSMGAIKCTNPHSVN